MLFYRRFGIYFRHQMASELFGIGNLYIYTILINVIFSSEAHILLHLFCLSMSMNVGLRIKISIHSNWNAVLSSIYVQLIEFPATNFAAQKTAMFHVKVANVFEINTQLIISYPCIKFSLMYFRVSCCEPPPMSRDSASETNHFNKSDSGMDGFQILLFEIAYTVKCCDHWTEYRKYPDKHNWYYST